MPSSPDPGDFPLQLDLVPGELSARVWLHDVLSIPCWSYTSDGLSAHGQDELILTVRLSQGEKATDVPKAPLQFFIQVLQFAQAGRTVGSGAITELGGTGLLGHRGIVYTSHREVYQDVDFTDGLAAIPLKDEEIEAAKAFGVTRILSLLGQAYRHYPWPPWADRTRPGLPLARLMEESILVQLNRIHAPGMTVCLERDRIVLRLTQGASTQLLNQLAQFPTSAPLVLLTELESSADGCLVWKPGQTQPKAITVPNGTGARLSGCFLALAPGQPVDEGQVVEDGLMMTLRDRSWQAIRDGLRNLSPVEIRAGNDGFGFALEWRTRDYANPVDGLTYMAEGGWGTSEPEGGRVEDSVGPTDVKQIVLLTPQHEIAQRLSVDALAEYIETIKGTVARVFGARPPDADQELFIQLELAPGAGADVKMASRPGIAADTLQRLYEDLCRTPRPSVTGGPVAFQVLFAIRGGAKSPQ
jgi:hypothetical protein